MTTVQIGDCTLHNGRMEDVLPALAPGSVDAVVTDPPAGIAFMGKEWDRFGGRSNANAEKDRAAANQGSGAGLGNQPFGYSGSAVVNPGQRQQFIAFLSAAMTEALRVLKPGGYALVWAIPRTSHWTATALEDAGFEIRDRISHLFGQGFPKAKSCLKPACEDWWLCRKPGSKVLPLSIDECRIPCESIQTTRGQYLGRMSDDAWGHGSLEGQQFHSHPAGRWPANVVHDGSEEVLEAFAAFGESRSSPTKRNRNPRQDTTQYRNGGARYNDTAEYGDTGTAARFFYCSKASKADRGEGNTHPTVKPTALMEWLVKLITRPGDTVLDPFGGSGSTAKACIRTGRRFVGCELDPTYFAIACDRVRKEYETASPLFETQFAR